MSIDQVSNLVRAAWHSETTDDGSEMTSETKTERATNGTLWLGDASDPRDTAAVLEDEDCTVEVERTDADEVAIHATLTGDNNALASFYLTRAEACFIAAQILAASTAGGEEGG